MVAAASVDMEKLSMVAATEANVEQQSMMALLDEMKIAVAALEETWRVAHAEADSYAAQLDSWKLETRKNGKQAIVEMMDTMALHVNRQLGMKQSVMDANVAVNVEQSAMDANLEVSVKESVMDTDVKAKVKQSTMDAVAMHAVVPRKSWDTKQKNLRRMAKRKLEATRDCERI